MTRVRGLAGGVVVGLLATIVAAVGTPADAALPQTFTGEIDPSDPTWRKPFVGNPPTTAVPVPNYHYETHAFTPTVSGEYRLRVTSNEANDLDPYLCVYAGTFDAATPLVNALECADDSSNTDLLPVITRALVAGQPYILVVTSGFGILNPGTPWGPFGPYVLAITPPPPVVSIVPRSMNEVDPGPAGLPVTVSIDSPQAEAVHIDIAAPPLDGQLHGTDSARGGLDYTTSVVSVTIPAGETSATFGVRVLGDTLDEATERATFTATSARVGNGTPFDPQAVGWITIVDDDEPQVLTVGAATVAEGNAGTTPMAVTVATTGAALHDVYVLVVQRSCETGVPATPGTDFTTFPAPPETGASWIRIPKGQSSATATIAVVGDTDYEADEIVCLRAPIAFYLQGGPGGDFSNVSPTGLPEDAFARTLARDFTGTITNDDAPPAVSASLAPSTLRVDEGATATMTVRFTPATAFATTLSWQAVDGVHPKGRATSADYAAGPRALTVPAGTTTATVTVATSADNLTETDEVFRVQLVGSTTPGVTIGAASTTTVTINGGQALPPPPAFPPPIFGLFR